MAKTPALGFMICPECGFEHAEIKMTKTNLAYRYCPDCNAQYFTRNIEGSERLKSKIVNVAQGGAGADFVPSEKKPINNSYYGV